MCDAILSIKDIPPDGLCAPLGWRGPGFSTFQRSCSARNNQLSSSLALYGISLQCMKATYPYPYAVCHKEPVRSKRRRIGSLDAQAGSLWHKRVGASNTTKLSTNESQAWFELDQWQWRKLPDSRPAHCRPGEDRRGHRARPPVSPGGNREADTPLPPPPLPRHTPPPPPPRSPRSPPGR